MSNSESRTILITGVSRRVGAHLATHLLAQGHRVIGTYRRDNDTIADLCRQGLIALPCDLNAPEAIGELVAKIQSKVETLDAVIHNASVWYDDRQCAERPERRAEMFHVHVTAPIELTERLQATLPAQGNEGRAGRLVVFMTDANIPHGKPDHVHYIASKAAADGAVRSLALKYAPHTRINAVAPGLIMFHPGDPEDYRRDRLSRRMLPYEPGPAVIASTIDYLLDCELVNATTITVDGGKI